MKMIIFALILFPVYCYSQKISISHIGENDKPFPEIVIVKNNKLIKSADSSNLMQFCVKREVFYELYSFILKKNTFDKPNSTKGYPYGTFLVRVDRIKHFQMYLLQKQDSTKSFFEQMVAIIDGNNEKELEEILLNMIKRIS